MPLIQHIWTVKEFLYSPRLLPWLRKKCLLCGTMRLWSMGFGNAPGYVLFEGSGWHKVPLTRMFTHGMDPWTETQLPA
jgi:hypothetical protein